MAKDRVWSCLKFKVAAGSAEALSERLDELGAFAVTLQAADDSLRFDEPEQASTLWTMTEVCAWFPAGTELAATVAGVGDISGIAGPPEQLTVADRDWVLHSQQGSEPVPITDRLWICPSWAVPPDPTAESIIIDPGRAFGSGQHATTRMCLRWLAQQPLAARRVLDYGCGSGVLAIVAVRFGATEAVGVDIDPAALLVARENAANNGAAERCSFIAPADLGPGRYETLLANILLGPLLDLRTSFAALQKPGDSIALAGVLAEQQTQLVEAFAVSYALQVQDQEGDWVLLTGECR